MDARKILSLWPAPVGFFLIMAFNILLSRLDAFDFILYTAIAGITKNLYVAVFLNFVVFSVLFLIPACLAAFLARGKEMLNAVIITGFFLILSIWGRIWRMEVDFHSAITLSMFAATLTAVFTGAVLTPYIRKRFFC